jgi:hypothetical protein
MWYDEGEVYFTLSFSESLRAVPIFLSEPEIGQPYIKDLVIGLFFALIGSISTIVTSIKNLKNSKMTSNADNNQKDSGGNQENEQELTTPILSAQKDEQDSNRLHAQEKSVL